MELYKGTFYKDEIEFLYNEILTNRKKISDSYEENNTYVNNIFTTKDNMLNTYSTHTYTTYV